MYCLYAGGSDAVRVPPWLTPVACIGRVVFQLGAGGGRDPPDSLSLAPLLQKHAEVNPAPTPFISRT